MTTDVSMLRGNSGTRTGKVLLIDEDAADLRVLGLVLEGKGFHVQTCKTYEAGLQDLETEAFDFVVVSQGTRAFEGRRVLERAMQLDRRRPVLIVTRSIDMPCYLEAMQMGAVDYMEKPVSPAELSQFVRAHIRSDRLQMQRPQPQVSASA
jgi:two-component system sensor histidine kinase/response regulator